MNALPPIKPSHMGAAMKDGRAYERDQADVAAGDDQAARRDWVDLAAKAVIVAGWLASTYLTVTM